MVGIVASIVGVSVTIVSQTTITVVTTVQDSGISFSLTFLTAIDGTKSIVGTISPSVGIGKTSLDSSTMEGIVASIVGVSVTIVSQTTITVVTTIQDSGISFCFTFLTAIDRSKSIVGTISPSVGVGK